MLAVIISRVYDNILGKKQITNYGPDIIELIVYFRADRQIGNYYYGYYMLM